MELAYSLSGNFLRDAILDIRVVGGFLSCGFGLGCRFPWTTITSSMDQDMITRSAFVPYLKIKRLREQ